MSENPNTEHIIIREGEPVLDTSVLDDLAVLIEQLYPGAWSVQEHGEDYPNDFAVRAKGQDDVTVRVGGGGPDDLLFRFSDHNGIVVDGLIMGIRYPSDDHLSLHGL